MVPVYAFSLLLGAGAALGLGWLAVNSTESAVPALAAGLITLAGGLVGARTGYLAVNWGYYRTQTGEIFELPWGGLSWGGALAGAILALALAVPLLRLSPARLPDQLFPLVALLAIGAWLGCWLDGCAYGPTYEAWFALPGRDEWGNISGRLPIQLLGVLGSLAALLAFDFGRRTVQPPGLAGVLALAALAVLTWWLSGLRVDPAPQWLGTRLDLWAARAFVLLSALALLTRLSPRRRPEKQPAD